ncbi:hypothetical protein DUI87_09159 [Hirundo rustica rustica]|uniref:Uncharacterized protein n=1 Tax=Hirundo rustica rustica TaxID=333673 RepID=A0A3M0KN90_HIRRU|nr:hypothetical protein DUI87_09159 [Hirundo rustica rustica]
MKDVAKDTDGILACIKSSVAIRTWDMTIPLYLALLLETNLNESSPEKDMGILADEKLDITHQVQLKEPTMS